MGSLTRNIKDLAVQASVAVQSIGQDDPLDDVDPRNVPREELEIEDDENSEFEPGTLMHKLDTMAEKAENYLEFLATGLSTQVSQLIEKAVVILPPELKSGPREISADRKSARVAAMRALPATYLTDYAQPDPNSSPSKSGIAQRYGEFISTFDVEREKEQIARLLRDDPNMSQLLTSFGIYYYLLTSSPESALLRNILVAVLFQDCRD